ncbi:MAG TPA: ACP S-malonyltransferase [Thermoanaerobaculia bacterium]|nr:ACP S-malonyltransferase [Thermoanaerobaculia bacterium]
MKLALVFPGQGAQKVGMGRDWADASPAARRTFEEADRALGEELSKLCWEGPEEELGLTANTQPAILTVSVAVARAVREAGIDLAPVAVAGHSLGEYSALVAAGALPFADAVQLVRRRGELMQEAVAPGVGAMAAILALDAAEVAAAVSQAQSEAETGQMVAVANYNANGQTVISGHAAAVERAAELARERGARKVTMLDVSAPFHSPLMGPARAGMEPLLAAAPLFDAAVPVVVNIDAEAKIAADDLRDALARQIDGPVRWVESVEHMEREMGVEAFVEMGPGNVLTGMIRRIAEQAKPVAVSEPGHLEKLGELLG